MIYDKSATNHKQTYIFFIVFCFSSQHESEIFKYFTDGLSEHLNRLCNIHQTILLSYKCKFFYFSTSIFRFFFSISFKVDQTRLFCYADVSFFP